MDRFVVKRVATVVVVALIVEAALFGAGVLSPALADVMRTIMLIVAGAFIVAVWRAARHRRPGDDRRQADRRDSSV